MTLNMQEALFGIAAMAWEMSLGVRRAITSLVSKFRLGLRQQRGKQKRSSVGQRHMRDFVEVVN
jgi:hypothetical protein